MNSCRGLGFLSESTLRRQNASSLVWAAQRSRHVTLLGGVVAASAWPNSRRSTSTKHTWNAPALPSAPKVADRVRSVLRHMPQSVVVITAAGLAPSPGQAKDGMSDTAQQSPEPVGMTVSSFASLDLDGDVAAVAFNVKRPSRTLDAIALGGGAFNVHVLAGTDAGARVAHHFTRPNGASPAAAASHGLFDDLERRTGCRAITYPSTPGPEPPTLRGPGILYVLKCSMPEPSQSSMLPVMNHTIVVAGVTDVIVGEVPSDEGNLKAASSVSAPESPDGAENASPITLGLTYGDRQYRSPGGAILNGDGSVPRTRRT